MTISNQLASLNLTPTTTTLRSNTCDDILTVAKVTKGKENSKNTFPLTDFYYVANIQSTLNDKPKIDNQHITPFSLDHLPNEIIESIFNQLSNDKSVLYQCSLVNKHLHAIANPSLWQDLFLNVEMEHPENFDTEERFFACLLEARPCTSQHIRNIYLRAYFWNNTRLALLIPRVCHLEVLEIGNYYQASPEDALEHLPRYCHHLTSLILGDLHLGHAFFASLGQHCHQLRRLRFSRCRLLSPDTFELLADCPLEEFYFFSDDPRDEMPLMNEKTLADLGKFDTLKSLEYHDPCDKSVSRILNMATLWPRLTKIALSNCYDTNDASFVPFITSHPLLQSVQLMQANITDISLNALSICLPSLTSVILYQCSNISLAGVRGLIQHACQLDFISLSDCGTILASDFLEAKRISEEWMHINRLALGKVKVRICGK